MKIVNGQDDAARTEEEISDLGVDLTAVSSTVNSYTNYSASGNIFTSFTSAVTAAFTSTIMGYETRYSYLGEAIKGVKVWINVENSNVPLICQLKKDDGTVIESASKVVANPGWQAVVFVFTKSFTTADIGDTNIRISVEISGTSSGRLKLGTVTSNARMTAGATENQNRYRATAAWANSNPGTASNLAVEFLAAANITALAPAVQDNSNWFKQFTLPAKIYCVVGHEMNIYFDNLIGDNVRKYWFDVVCTVGVQQAERWTYTPLAAATTAMTINVYDDMDNLVQVLTTSIVAVAADAQTGTTKICLFMGGSTTRAGVYTGELLTLFGADAMDITLIGTQGSDGNFTEGYDGKTVAWFYSDAESPFVFSGAFNFSTYMSTHSFAAVNWLFIHLGINDVASLTSDTDVDTVAATNVTQITAMINSAKTFNASIKVGLMLPILPSTSQDAFGKSYSSGINQRRYKRNIHRLTKAMITAFGSSEASSIYIVPTNVNIDTVNNMQTESVAVNSRNSTTVTRQANGVHPANSGYYQMADTVFAGIKAIS